MENKIRPVEIDNSYTDVYQIKEQYAIRFGYKMSKDNLCMFKNRLISAIAGNIYDESDLQFYTRRIFEMIGYAYTGVKESEFDGSLLHQLLEALEIKNQQDIYTWLQIIEMVANSISSEDGQRQYIFTQRIAVAIKLSGINAVLCIEENNYKFFPYSDAFFDKALVLDILNWLEKYDKAKEQYRQALDYILTGKYDRQVIDCLRLALELFLKQLLRNNKSLENQMKALGTYIGEKNISNEISNMFFKLLECYEKYNNSHAKHDDSVNENEVDFLLYMTGSFMRFLVKLNADKVHD